MTFVKAYIGETPLFQGSSVGATIIKTGQTVSYTTGDDGDIEAGRQLDFLTLALSNPFGNTNRFTALDGSQTYSNDIFIDWSTYNGITVLGYYRGSMGISRLWSDAILWANGLNIAGFTGWRLTNIRELQNIANYEVGLSSVGSYAPVNLISQTYWTSTTVPSNSSNAIVMSTATGDTSSNNAKTLGRRTIACRNFNVNGTTLT